MLTVNLVRDILICTNNFENFENLIYFFKYSRLVEYNNRLESANFVLFIKMFYGPNKNIKKNLPKIIMSNRAKNFFKCSAQKVRQNYETTFFWLKTS